MNFSRSGSVSSRVLLESIARDIRYAFRSFRRTPLVALTIVTTVGLGLGLVAAVFTILNAFVFRADAVRNPHELFGVEWQRAAANAEPDTFTRTQYEALVRETGVFSAAFAKTEDIDAWIEGRRLEGPLVTGNFFQVLGVGAGFGRTLTPADDQPGARPVIVLSHRAWTQHFASEPGVLNRAIRVNGASFEVVGVMPERFRGLGVFAPDYWAPVSLRRYFHAGEQGREDAAGLHVIGRLDPGMTRGQALARLVVWDSQRVADRSRERPATSLVLEPRSGTVPLSPDVLLQFTPLFFAFGLILVIGCANVANLLLARAVARQREIGIRLAVGASRRRLIVQLLTESLVLALLSAALGLGISRLVLAGVVYGLTSTFPPDIGNIRIAVPSADWRVVLFLIGGAALSTVFFALAPAFQATRLELVRAIRGEVMRDGRPSRARHALVTLQVTASVLLLLCAAIFLRSSWAAANVDLGIRTDGILNLTILNEQKRADVLNVVRSEPAIASVAAAWPGFLGGPPAFAEAGSGKVSVSYQFVSPDYFRVFDVNLVRGRPFAESERSASSAVAIVSEAVARELWPGQDAIGQTLRLEPDASAIKGDAGNKPMRADDPQLASRSVVVIGVARDVPGFRVGEFNLTGAGVYVPITAEASRTSLSLRVRGDAERARQALIDRLAAIDPNMVEVSSLAILASGAAYILAIPFWLTLVLGALALVLTLSGLFSVLSYLVEQRRREIGVRMALGATNRMILALIFAQSARPVGIGLVVGATLTIGIGAALLATPAAALIGPIVRVFDPVAYAASLLCIVTACAGAALIPALRAARINPVAALRQD